ncbi:WhiB family transcriptional regulator [Streptomyces netropsis]
MIPGRRSAHLPRGSAAGALGFDPAPDPGLKDALCKVIEPELFFPERGDHRTAALARELCAKCPVIEVCLADALMDEGAANHRRRFGIRGGATPQERYEMYQRTARTAQPVAPPVGAPAPARAKREPVRCGTRRGYQKHRRNGESACDACRHANAAADRRLRTTGSTREAVA